MHLNRGRKAFTLIELIVVIVIIGILAAIAAFSFNAVLNSTRGSAAETVAAQLDRDHRAALAFKYNTTTGVYDALNGTELAAVLADAPSAEKQANVGNTAVTVRSNGKCVTLTLATDPAQSLEYVDEDDAPVDRLTSPTNCSALS